MMTLSSIFDAICAAVLSSVVEMCSDAAAVTVNEKLTWLPGSRLQGLQKKIQNAPRELRKSQMAKT